MGQAWPRDGSSHIGRRARTARRKGGWRTPRLPPFVAAASTFVDVARGATVDLMTAARALGCGRSLAYELARRGEFPCEVLRLGSRYVVPTAALLRTLGVTVEPTSPANDIAPGQPTRLTAASADATDAVARSALRQPRSHRSPG
jgi:hypothetical protein